MRLTSMTTRTLTTELLATVLALGMLLTPAAGDERAPERTKKINRVAKDIFNPLVSPEQLNKEIREAVEVDFPTEGPSSSREPSANRSSGSPSSSQTIEAGASQNWHSDLPYCLSKPPLSEYNNIHWFTRGGVRIGIQICVSGSERNPDSYMVGVTFDTPNGKKFFNIFATEGGLHKKPDKILRQTIVDDKYLRVYPPVDDGIAFDGKYIYDPSYPDVRLLIGKPKYGEKIGASSSYKEENYEAVNILELPFDIIGHSSARKRIADLQARASPTAGEIILEWTSVGERYDIRLREDSPVTSANWNDPSTVDVEGERPPKARGQSDSFTVIYGIESGRLYHFAISSDGEISNSDDARAR